MDTKTILIICQVYNVTLYIKYTPFTKAIFTNSSGGPLYYLLATITMYLNDDISPRMSTGESEKNKTNSVDFS